MTRQEFPIEQQLRKDIQEAQRARDQVRLDTLRMALGAIHNLEVARTDRKNAEFGQPLTAADCLKVLEQEVKKRSQAIPLYQQGGRLDMVEKEQREMDILQAEDIAEAIAYVVTRPRHVAVNEILVRPTQQEQ